ncbi:MAG TPA: glycoside hydrolase family 2 TIM barrel-domain containing protein [Bacteroidota bacterium]|nr:glycoside hydrolase family 2 TIM barrel-domain containing protein [Bacteroidota bacterium]
MKKHIQLVSLFSLCLLTLVRSLNAEEKIPGRQSFDSDWKFSLGDSAMNAGAPTFNDTGWRQLDLPHDWSIEGAFDRKNPMGGAGGYLPAGIGWYRKHFTVPSSLKNKRVSIYFEGVYMNSEVFINGTSLGVHPYGYTSFSYDITPYLNFNKDNVLAVRVDNSQQTNCRWYSGSGIYRHVWMNVTDNIHLTHWGVGITTSDVSPEKATVSVKSVVRNETDITQTITLATKLSSAHVKNAGMQKQDVEIPPHSEKEILQSIAVTKPRLWTPETPNLYQAVVRVEAGKKTADERTVSFGIRSIAYSVEHGFQLNGKTVKLNGGCVHHDNGCLGAAAFDRAEIRRVELLKAAGFNAIRTSHNPPSEVFLRACDELGMMVIDEAFDGWREKKTPFDYARYFDQWWQRDIDAMVMRDRNHPSIIMWSTGNEIIERKSPEAVQTATMLASRIRLLDPTRPVTSAMTTWDKEWEIFDPLFAAHDVGGYNYQLHRALSDHQRVPSRIMVQTESYPRDAFTNWKLVRDNSYIIGDFVWTALDYLGESGIGRSYYPGDTPGEHWEADFYPWHGAYCGDIDLTGWRKPISHYRSMLYNNTEKLYLAVREPNPDSGKITETLWSVWPTWESWTWPGREGKAMNVEVYSTYPKVRLYLNNRLIGEQTTSEEQQFKATFSVPYAPGVLRAAGVVDTKEVESTILKTSEAVARIRLTPDRVKIASDGQDLSFVTVLATDKNGTLQPNAYDELQVTITGPGVIAGVDNAKLNDTTSYGSTSRHLWHGRAMVVVRSTKKSGAITLTVRSRDLAKATVTIKAEETKK